MVGLVNKEVSKNALTIHSDPSKDTQFSIERAIDRAILDIKHNLSEHSVSFVCESAKINKIFHYKLLDGEVVFLRNQRVFIDLSEPTRVDTHDISFEVLTDFVSK